MFTSHNITLFSLSYLSGLYSNIFTYSELELPCVSTVLFQEFEVETLLDDAGVFVYFKEIVG